MNDMEKKLNELIEHEIEMAIFGEKKQDMNFNQSIDEETILKAINRLIESGQNVNTKPKKLLEFEPKFNILLLKTPSIFNFNTET